MSCALAGARAFPAASRFSALPSAGRLPPGAINAADFTQSYFPAEVDADFSIIPEDELPALIEDALALPPIDLTLPGEALDSTAVAILAPVPRNEWRAVSTRLTTRVRPLRPAAPNLVAQRKPLETLLRLRPLVPILPLPDPADPSDAEWQRLARLPNLWFVRRRQLAYRDDLAGTSLRFAAADDGTCGRQRARAHRRTRAGDESRSRAHGCVARGDGGGHATARFAAVRGFAGADGGGARRAQRARGVGRRHRHGGGRRRHVEPYGGGRR